MSMSPMPPIPPPCLWPSTLGISATIASLVRMRVAIEAPRCPATRPRCCRALAPNVRDMDLRQIWYDSEGFNRFRGTGWMKEPCRSCPEQEKDLGGCRCQAYLLSGDPANADPVCDKSSDHRVVTEAVEKAQRGGKPAIRHCAACLRQTRNGCRIRHAAAE